MALESKPLFHPEVIRQQVRASNLPERVEGWQPKLRHWAGLITSGRADELKETALRPDFLTDIFSGLLGDTRPTQALDSYTLSREKHVEVDGEFADAVLGRLQKDKEQFISVLEGKGTRDPLERPFAGSRMSVVDQACRCAINLPCDWIIVTSMRETRVYYKGAHQQAYERFETVRLAADEALLKRFVFLLGAERVVPAQGDCHLYELLRASESVGRALTNQFYALYADIRQRVLTRLCRENPAIAPQAAGSVDENQAQTFLQASAEKAFTHQHHRFGDLCRRLISPLMALIVLTLGCAAPDAFSGPAPSPESDRARPAPVFHIQDRTVEPLLQADKRWEGSCMAVGTVIREGDRWRMWYSAYDRNHKLDDDAYLCYAESPDGSHWTKPVLGIVEYEGNKDNNILISGTQAGGFAFSSVFLDEGKDPHERYKMIWQRFKPQNAWWVYGGTSSDGLHWTLLPKPLSPRNSNTTTPCIPDGGKYRLYTRVWQGGDFRGARAVGYTESDHFGDFPEPREILSHDANDPAGMQFYSNAASKLADHLYVMFPAAFYTKEQRVRSHLAWSRDGVHFTRYGREPVVDLGTKFDTKGVYVAPRATPGPAPNTWWFYYSGTNVEHDSNPNDVKFDGGVGRFLLVME